MSVVVVTGASGTLGTPTTAKLKGEGFDVRALSRSTRPEVTTADLLTGVGVSPAFVGADAVVHLSTGRRDVDQARAAIDAARAAKVGHFVLISIVGIDSIPLGYYKSKVVIEKLLIESGLPHSILRATQFHQFVDGIFRAQKLSPVILAPRFSFQPISTDEVAARLVELVNTKPAGRVADIGGPEQRTARDLASAWKTATGSRRVIANLPLPGKTAAAYAAGHNLVAGAPYGVATFEEYLDATYGVRPPATHR